MGLFGCSDPKSPNENTSKDNRKDSNKLPYIGHQDILEVKVNGEYKIDTVYETIPDFEYLNQDSILVSRESYKNKIWVVEFFFASCPTICPLMNVEMSKLNKWIENEGFSSHFQFLSFSIDPKNDTPKILNAYKKSYCDSCSNWDLLTGDEDETHRLGIESFKIFAGKDEEAQGGYAHSGAFSLVDKSQRVRGVYNITDYTGNVNKKEFNRLTEDIIKLLQYEYDIQKLNKIQEGNHCRFCCYSHCCCHFIHCKSRRS